MGQFLEQLFIGCKQVSAVPEVSNGEEGYAVKDRDGCTSWTPRAEFEDEYLPMGEGSDGTKITEQMVKDFVTTVVTQKMGNKTTVVQAELRNGFIITESSSCVEAANYDEEVGRGICMARIESKVWELLGMLLQTARHGIKLPHVPSDPAEDVEAVHEPGDQGPSPKSLDSEPE